VGELKQQRSPGSQEQSRLPIHTPGNRTGTEEAHYWIGSGCLHERDLIFKIFPPDCGCSHPFAVSEMEPSFAPSNPTSSHWHGE
jgi:hypothetical protein